MTRRHALVLGAVALVLVYLLVRREVLGTDDMVLLGVLIPSVVLHEVSHGAAALAFGDDTARNEGRLSLNPVRHVDPLGTVALPAFLVLVGAAPFGYAKPVPVNPRRMRHPRNHGLLVSLAGPAVNIVLAVAAALAVREVSSSPFVDPRLWVRALALLGLANVLLAAFNLIPIPPLDGSAVIERFLPARWWPGYLRLRQYSMVVLIVLVLLLPGALDLVFDPAVDLWRRLLA